MTFWTERVEAAVAFGFCVFLFLVAWAICFPLDEAPKNTYNTMAVHTAIRSAAVTATRLATVLARQDL